MRTAMKNGGVERRRFSAIAKKTSEEGVFKHPTPSWTWVNIRFEDFRLGI